MRLIQEAWPVLMMFMAAPMAVSWVAWRLGLAEGVARERERIARCSFRHVRGARQRRAACGPVREFKG